MSKLDQWLEAPYDEAERENESHQERAAELLNGSYSPFLPDNIQEAISNECLYQNDDLQTIADYMEQRKFAELGLLVKVRIEEYWEKMADSHAYDDWEKRSHG